MNDFSPIYLICPIISIVSAVYIAAMGIFRVRLKLENVLMALICLSWAVLSMSYVVQHFIEDEGRILMLERITHFFIVYLPLVHILFFHRVLGLKQRKMVLGTVFLSVIFSLSVFSRLYITGVKKYDWGYFAQAGPLFFVFLLFALATVFYVIYLVASRLKKEGNLVLAMKIRYTRFAYVSSAVITMLSVLPMMGYDVYPPGYFIFIPLGFLGYGLLRYRILGIRSMFHIAIIWFTVFILTILPNIILFVIIRTHLGVLSTPWAFVGLMAWFILNFQFVLKIQTLVGRALNADGYDLKKMETSFFKSFLFLKNVKDLIDEFRSLMITYLAFSDVDFFLPGEDKGAFENAKGQRLSLSLTLGTWLLADNHMIDRNMVETHPRFDAMKEELTALFDQQNAQYLVPLAQHERLLSIAFLKDEYLNRLMTNSEVRFIDRLSGIVSISLYNAMVFRDISALKDLLEDKTLKLSEEISERKKAEETIKKSREQYKLLADNVKDTIWVLWINELTFSYMSPSVKGLLGYTVREIMHMSVEQLLTQESFEFIKKVRINVLGNDQLLNMDTPLTMELEHIRKDGTHVWVEVSSHLLNSEQGPLSLIGVSRDITERKKAEIEKKNLEAKLMQAQKMESIGVLAGGIAHDFNNILMAILGYAQLARLYITEENTQAHEKLSRIEKASFRAKGMVAQILAFSRQNDYNKLSLQMAPIIMEALNLLKVTLPSDIRLIPEFQDNVPSVMADPVQIHQVIINLCSNAAHAMESTGGECRIGLSRYPLDLANAQAMNLPPGIYIRLTVEDSGSGMDKNILDKIFDPYFTTKDVGKGTGMGLAVVHGIVLSCGGKIKVKSTLGKGTCFEIILPAAENPVKNIDDDRDIISARGKERILFVDDDEDITELAEEILGELGYTVSIANDGQMALGLFLENPQDFDIVVTDLTMPHISGERLAEQIYANRPDLPVILCTGYNTYLPDQRTRDIGIVDILIKPVPGKDLADAIRSALDAGK
ncbi:MAG: response regulator [Proteobacteria bacterium]|nr:response regulator [Pseudomonadota bacterium]